ETPQGVIDPSSPLGVSVFGPRIDDYALNLGLTKKNLLGGTLGLDFKNDFSRFKLNGSPFNSGALALQSQLAFPLNPQDQSALTLSYTQPLLKGAGVAAN